jgi:hypothetical protein
MVTDNGDWTAPQLAPVGSDTSQPGKCGSRFTFHCRCSRVWEPPRPSRLLQCRGDGIDQSSSVVPAAKVELVSATGTVRAAETNSEGYFRFNNVIAGLYTLNITSSGFKQYTQKEINLASSETRDLGRMTLQLGAQADQISVEASATPVQTSSAEKSYMVTQSQLETVALKGRDIAGLLQTMPGITNASGGDTTSISSLGAVGINGGGQKNITFDGVMALDAGNGSGVMYAPNMDSVAEIRVLSANYQAEYGRNASGSISVITKGGSRDIHGSVWWNHRHEQFNANSFFNNRSGVQRSFYRYNIPGYTISGPVFIPGLLTSRNRLFFFWSQEYTRQKLNTSTSYFKMPTPAELGGDFSGYVNSNGAAQTIKDPLNNNAPFPGNKIDPTRIDKTGLGFLTFFPQPNYVETLDLTQQYSRNYKSQATPEHPRRNDTLRIDLNITSNLSGYVRYGHDYDLTTNIASNFGVLDSSGQRSPYKKYLDNSGHQYASGLTYTISPTMVNELVIGKGYTQWNWSFVDPSQVSRDKMGNPPHWYDSSKLQQLVKSDPRFFAEYVPYVSFSGGQLPGSPSIGESVISDQEPRAAMDNTWTINDSISRLSGAHSLKAGIYFEHTSKIQGKGSYYNGYYNFGASSTGSSPLDTGNGYANALLGYVQQYQEGNKTIYDVSFNQIEWYVQDSWKVSRRLTLDLGASFTSMPAWNDRNKTFAGFYLESWDAKQAPRLYTYGKSANGTKIAVDPLNPSNTRPAVYAGLYVTDTAGNVIGNASNGWKQAGANGAPQGMFSVAESCPRGVWALREGRHRHVLQPRRYEPGLRDVRSPAGGLRPAGLLQLPQRIGYNAESPRPAQHGELHYRFPSGRFTACRGFLQRQLRRSAEYRIPDCPRRFLRIRPAPAHIVAL